MNYILLIEDDALSRMVVEDVLENGDILFDFPIQLVCLDTGE